MKLTEREHKILVVTEWHEFKKDREAFDEALRHIAALKGTNKTDIEACEERLNEMKYGDKKAPQKDIDVENRKWERLDQERESLLKREGEIGRESMQRYNDLDAFLELAKNGSRYWTKAKPEKKRILADMIVSNVIVDGDKVASVTLTPQFEAWAKRGKNLDGRDDRTRTCDLTVPNRALYQLSYIPNERKHTENACNLLLSLTSYFVA